MIKKKKNGGGNQGENLIRKIVRYLKWRKHIYSDLEIVFICAKIKMHKQYRIYILLVLIVELRV